MPTYIDMLYIEESKETRRTVQRIVVMIMIAIVILLVKSIWVGMIMIMILFTIIIVIIMMMKVMIMIIVIMIIIYPCYLSNRSNLLLSLPLLPQSRRLCLRT